MAVTISGAGTAVDTHSRTSTRSRLPQSRRPRSARLDRAFAYQGCPSAAGRLTRRASDPIRGRRSCRCRRPGRVRNAGHWCRAVGVRRRPDGSPRSSAARHGTVRSRSTSRPRSWPRRGRSHRPLRGWPGRLASSRLRGSLPRLADACRGHCLRCRLRHLPGHYRPARQLRSRDGLPGRQPGDRGLATGHDREITEAASSGPHCGKYHERLKTRHRCRQAMPGSSRCQPDVTERHRLTDRRARHHGTPISRTDHAFHDRGPCFSS